MELGFEMKRFCRPATAQLTATALPFQPMAVGALVAILTIAPGLAQDVAAPADAAKASAAGWIVNCATQSTGGDFLCQMSRTVAVSGVAGQGVSVILRTGGETKGLTALVVLPHGVFFPSGVTLGVDGAQPQTVEVQTSDPRGAYAAFPLADSLLAALKAGRTLEIGFVDVRRKALKAAVPLTGFTAAVDKLQAMK